MNQAAAVEISRTNLDATELVVKRCKPLRYAHRAAPKDSLMGDVPEGPLNNPPYPPFFPSFPPHRSMSVATSAVHPVWWLAPSPRPVSPSKYS